MNTLHNLFEYQLKCLFNAEIEIASITQHMVEVTSPGAIQEVLTLQLEQSLKHKNDIDVVCEDLQADPRGKYCKGIIGAAEGVVDFLSENASQEVIDLGILAETKRMAYFKLSSYDSLYANAVQLHYIKISEKIKEIQNEVAQTLFTLKDLTENNGIPLPASNQRRLVKSS